MKESKFVTKPVNNEEKKKLDIQKEISSGTSDFNPK